MSANESEAKEAVLSVKDLLAYDEEQLISYMKSYYRDGQLELADIFTDLDGVLAVSQSQRNELADRFCNAAYAANAAPVDADDLRARLEAVARAETLTPPEPQPPTNVGHLEKACHQELIDNGCRPACSIDELSYILFDHMNRYEPIQAWLVDEPDSYNAFGYMQTVLSRQFWQWWNFRKFQWDSRGLNDSEAFSAFLEAEKRIRRQTNGPRGEIPSHFEETMRRKWQHVLQRFYLVPEGQKFSAYVGAVKTKLAPYDLTPLPQLRKDPRRQNAWTDWLEYLSFEIEHLKSFTLSAESRERKFLKAMHRLRWPDEANGNDSTQTRQRSLGGKGAGTAKELAPEQDATQKRIDNFLRDTESYTLWRKQAYYQKLRVNWVVKEARLMKTEISLQREKAKIKKRRERDDELPEPRPKRTTRRAGNGSAISARVAGSARDTRRSTLRSAHRPGTKV